MSKHTPGPWTLRETIFQQESDLKDLDLWAGDPVRGKSLALIYQDNEQDLANARLIAAAPEMLEIMKRALKLALEHRDFNLAAMDPFWDVIAKAEGREP